MASTPRPYLWEDSTSISLVTGNSGFTAHYYTEEAQVFYLDDGIKTKITTIPEGHWKDTPWERVLKLTDDNFTVMTFDHPANTTLYGAAILENSDDLDTLYLLRYDYSKDISAMVESGSWKMQADNPISQLSLSLKNTDSDLFLSSTTLFSPGARITLNFKMGKSSPFRVGTTYLDDISYDVLGNTVKVSARNSIGFVLNDQTMDSDETIEASSIVTVCETILNKFGLRKREIGIDAQIPEKSFSWSANETGVQVFNRISDCNKLGGRLEYDWGIEEMYDGTIICGTAFFRNKFYPRTKYTIENSQLFTKKVAKSIDGVYTHVRVTGTDKDGNDLTPIYKEIDSFPYWYPGNHRTYHASLSKVNQWELENFANSLCNQLKYTGKTQVYASMFQPRLLVGDVARVATTNSDGEREFTDLGMVTEVTHNFGEKGYTTTFSVDSGGEYADIEDKTYSSIRGNNGNNRIKRIMDFVKK